MKREPKDQRTGQPYPPGRTYRPDNQSQTGTGTTTRPLPYGARPGHSAHLQHRAPAKYLLDYVKGTQPTTKSQARHLEQLVRTSGTNWREIKGTVEPGPATGSAEPEPSLFTKISGAGCCMTFRQPAPPAGFRPQ
jgi:hypothetical protein